MFDCRLLPEFLLIVGTSPSLYSCLRGSVRPYFDTMTTSILIAFSRPRLRMRPVRSATLPNWLSCSCNVVSKHYAPDKNQAIHRMISCHTVPQNLNLNLDILLPVIVTVVGTSANKLVGSAYRKLLMPHLTGYLACVIDLIGDQLILCQRRI